MASKLIDEIPCPVCARPSLSRGHESSALGRLRGAFVFDRACNRCGVAFTVNLPTILYGRIFPLNRSATVIRPLNEGPVVRPALDNDRWFEMDLHPAFLNTERSVPPHEPSTEDLPDPRPSPSEMRDDRTEPEEPFQFDLRIGTFRVSLRADASLPPVAPWIVSSFRSTVRLVGTLVLLLVPKLQELLEEPNHRPARKPLRFRSETMLGVPVPPEAVSRVPKKSSGTR